MGIFVEANAPYLLIVHCIDLVGRCSKTIARVVVTIDSPDFFRRITEIVFDLELRRNTKNIADIAEARLLIGGDYRYILLSLGILTVVKYVVFTFILLHNQTFPLAPVCSFRSIQISVSFQSSIRG